MLDETIDRSMPARPGGWVCFTGLFQQGQNELRPKCVIGPRLRPIAKIAQVTLDT